MPHTFDAANKFILDAYPADWVALAGLPPGSAARVVDADLSAVSKAADKLVRVEAAEPYIAHLEFQTSHDAGLDARVLVYNVLAYQHLKLPVRSVVFLLRPEALTPAVTGGVSYGVDPEDRLDFTYRLVRVWGLPVDLLLKAGIGTLPLAPISAVREADLPGVIEAMTRRLDAEVPGPRVLDVWTATRILMGLRYSEAVVTNLLRGVRQMKESTTYQAILREGLEQGIEKGIEQGRAREARALLLRLGARQFGAADQTVRARLEAIGDVQRLEDLLDRVSDRAATSWGELLGP